MGPDETPDARTYVLINRHLMRQLMERTGSGERISVRGLADKAGVSHGLIGNLLTGVTTAVPAVTAYAISDAIGVDVLILWCPAGRSTGPGVSEAAGPQPQAVPA